MTVIGIVLCLAALVVGLVAGMMMFGKQQSAVPEAERAKLVDAARAEAAEVKRAAQLESMSATSNVFRIGSTSERFRKM